LGIAVPITLSAHEQGLLQKIVRSRTLGSDLRERAQIVLAASDGLNNRQIEQQYGIERHRVGTWRNRFHQSHEHWKSLAPDLRPRMNEPLIHSWLAVKAGRGRKAQITAEQKKLILAVACEHPSKSGYPHTHWSDRLLAKEVIKRGIVDYIGFQTVWSFLKDSRPETAQKPLLSEVRRKRERPGEVQARRKKTLCHVFDCEGECQKGDSYDVC
jgi:transposase